MEVRIFMWVLLAAGTRAEFQIQDLRLKIRFINLIATKEKIHCMEEK